MSPAAPVARFRILGPIEVASARAPVHGPRQLALLAFLIVHANRRVSTEQLIDALWGGQPMAGAVKRVHVAVRRLRTTLDGAGRARTGGPLRTVSGGYLLAIEPGDVDADLFRALVDDGRGALLAGRPVDAGAALRGALGMWRGPPLADVAFEEFAQAEIHRLEELRLDAVELVIDADLACGRHRQVLVEIESLMCEQPFRERPRAQQMLALYRSGRQAAALAAFHELRRALLAELGIEPGPEIRELHEAILRQDPSLEIAPANARETTTPPLVEAPTRVTAGRSELRLVRSAPMSNAAPPVEVDVRRAHGPLVGLQRLREADEESSQAEEQRLTILERRMEADLGLGHHAQVIGELQQLVAEYPWRERLHGQLMLALYRAGRQAEALEAYQHARAALAERVGSEPVPELHELNQAILVHDPALDPSRATGGPADSRRSRLVAPPNRTIGRDHEVASIGERLRAGSVRLLTLTGPGGVGKTRLALDAARHVEADFADGAHFVSLDSVRRPQDVAATFVATMEIVPLAGESAEQAVQRFLAAKRVLVVLDNFEHVLDAAPFIGRLLASSPDVTVLATSREPLTLQAEERQPVEPLALPPARGVYDHAALAGVDAVARLRNRWGALDFSAPQGLIAVLGL